MSPAKSKRRYSIWQALGLSFYSRDLYRDVKKNWKGTGLGFLCLLLAALGLVRATQVQILAADDIPKIAQQIPPFKIDHGVLSADVSPQPYRFDFKDNCIVVDTTGKTQTLDQIPNTLGLKSIYLVTQKGYWEHRIRLGQTLDKSHLFKPTTNFEATRENIDRWARIVVDLSGTLFFIAFLFFVFVMEVVVLLIYSLIGVLFAEMAHKNLDYGDSFRLAVISHIPGLLVFNALALLQVQLPLPVLWSMLVSIGYIYFAVSSQPKSQTPS